MRRPIIVGVAFGAVLAVMPLASQAATVPSVSLIAPSSGHATRGDLLVKWSYSGFHRTTPIDIEASNGGGAFERLARTTIDDGTPGYFGSATVSTASLLDGTDYTIRVRVPTRTSVHSSATPVTVDNTGPTATVTAEPITDPAPATSITADVEGTAEDALSEVASVQVTFSEGSDPVEATCTGGCGTTATTWSVSTDGLAPGLYTVTAVATDALGNVGPAGSADMVIVGTPEDPTPPLVALVTTTAEQAIATATTATEEAIEDATTATEEAIEDATTATEEAIEDATTTPTAGEVTDTATTTTEGLVEALTTTTTVATVVETVTTATGDGT